MAILYLRGQAMVSYIMKAENEPEENKHKAVDQSFLPSQPDKRGEANRGGLGHWGVPAPTHKGALSTETSLKIWVPRVYAQCFTQAGDKNPEKGKG